MGIDSSHNPNIKIPDCKIYREGNFHFTNLSNGIDFEVTRKKDSQIVFIINPENYAAKQGISWVTDCTYKITFTEINDRSVVDPNYRIIIGDSFLIQITNNRTKDFYQYSYVTTDGKKYLNKMYISKK